MPMIYTGAAGQRPPPPDRDLALTAFANPKYLLMLQCAMLYLQSYIVTSTPCNDTFRALPLRKSLVDIWHDPSIYIYFRPTVFFVFKGRPVAARGISDVMRRFIVLTPITLEGYHTGHGQEGPPGTPPFWVPDTGRIGARAVAATLLHELAHFGGAPDNTSQAESVLNGCGFDDLWDPKSRG